MVGAAGVEPATFCTPSKRATRLRYAPLKKVITKCSRRLRRRQTETKLDQHFVASDTRLLFDRFITGLIRLERFFDDAFWQVERYPYRLAFQSDFDPAC